MASKEPLLCADLRIVLIGKVGDAKTSVMSAILRSSEENQKPAYNESEKCQKEEVKIGGKTVVLVDTPGLCKAGQKVEEVKQVMQEVKRCVSLTAPGPHVFLFVLSCEDRFTAREQDMVKIFKETFGDSITCYTMVLFTDGAPLMESGTTIQEFIGESKALKSFLDECNRYHVFDSDDEDPSQVSKLLEEIDAVVQRNIKENKGEYYTPKQANLKKRISRSVTGSAVAGAVVGGAVSYLTGSPIGVALGATAGGAVGGIVGGAGILVVEWAKEAKRWMQQ